MNENVDNEQATPATEGREGEVQKRSYQWRAERRVCTAKRSNGEPCRKSPMKHSNACSKHGGKAPQTLAAAARRGEKAAYEMMGETLVIARAALDDPNVPSAVKLKAALAVLDRAGIGPKSTVDVAVEVAPWQELLAGVTQMEGGSRAASRARRGLPDTTPRLHDVVDAEVVEERAVCAGCGLDWTGRTLPDWLDAPPEFCRACRAERGLPRPGRDGRSYPSRADTAELRQPPAPTGPPTPPATGASDTGLMTYADAVAAYAEAKRQNRTR